MPTRVVHVITTLDVGGAEISLERLISATDPARIKSSVVSLSPPGAVASRLTERGIPVFDLGMRPRRVTPGDFNRLVGLLRSERAEVVQSWMYHADVLAGLAARRVGGPAVVWGLHYAAPLSAMRRATRLVAHTAARMSRRVPARIVCSSQASRDAHAARGYPPAKLLIIPNGFPVIDPQADARAGLRDELGLDSRTLLVGRIARFHPDKDYRTFVSAARVVADRRPDVHFVCAGYLVGWDNAELAGWIRSADLEQRFHLLGPRSDSARLHAAFDVAVSASRTESLPLVVGEAMAAGCPVVATDVGDTRALLGPGGAHVPARSPGALGAAINEILSLPSGERSAMGAAGRAHIQEHYSLDGMVERYTQLYEAAAAR